MTNTSACSASPAPTHTGLQTRAVLAQSLSKMMTVSAVCRLRPRPPARVDRMKMKYSESGALNFTSSSPRSSAFVAPSSRRYL